MTLDAYGDLAVRLLLNSSDGTFAAAFTVIDVIDLDYGPGNAYHHSTQDTPDKVSAESLTLIGRVALALIRAEEKRN